MSQETHHLPWYNRWAQPSLEELIAPLSTARKATFDTLIKELDQVKELNRSLDWYGPGWHWALAYTFKDEEAGDLGVLCYIVPNPEATEIVVPLADEHIEKLPIKRLNKLIREGIDVAKCAVETHWAAWSPVNQSEVNHVLDLLKRLRQIKRDLAGSEAA